MDLPGANLTNHSRHRQRANIGPQAVSNRATHLGLANIGLAKRKPPHPSLGRWLPPSSGLRFLPSAFPPDPPKGVASLAFLIQIRRAGIADRLLVATQRLQRRGGSARLQDGVAADCLSGAGGSGLHLHRVSAKVFIIWGVHGLVTLMFGTAAANRRQEEERQATAIVAAMDVSRKRQWGGSVFEHEVKNRKKDEINEQIMANYFNDPPLYGDDLFRRRFRMRKSLFLRIVNDVKAKNIYFIQKKKMQ
ncbi:hypothetical protein U9M48_040618 [Paspalum notatum var. saurae]|uniref:Uncharacterized protein n=1 Tax=Paspalum notatum var. saurae TaxID=547442 RepID=A0AAQ3UNG1_PASNO